MTLDRDQLQGALRNVMVPALAASAGTGALGAYISSRNHDPRETPQQRRQRIMRNAMLSAGLGGVVGATLPTGLKMLAEPYSGGITGGPGLVDRAVGLGVSNAAPLAVLAGGGLAMAGERGHVQKNVENHLLGRLKNVNLGTDLSSVTHGFKTVENPEVLKVLMRDPLGRRWLTSQLNGTGGMDIFDALNTIQAGGAKAGLDDLVSGSRFPNVSQFKSKGDALAALVQKLEGGSPMEKGIAWLSKTNNPLDRVIGAVGKRFGAGPGAAGRIAETYFNRIRPGAAAFGRIHPMTGLMGIGGAALAAKVLQDKVMGN